MGGVASKSSKPALEFSTFRFVGLPGANKMLAEFQKVYDHVVRFKLSSCYALIGPTGPMYRATLLLRGMEHLFLALPHAKEALETSQSLLQCRSFRPELSTAESQLKSWQTSNFPFTD